MRKKGLFLASFFILSFGIAFSQQFNIFDVSLLEGVKIKYDRYGDPWAVGLSSQGYFYLFKSESGQFKSPVLIGKTPNVKSSPYVEWDFDIDTSGVVHIAGVIYERFRDSYDEPTPFYLNSAIDSAVVFNAIDLGPFSPAVPSNDYIKVLRTKDDNLVVNIVVWFPYWTYDEPDSLIWIRLFNPSANNINATIDTIVFDSLSVLGVDQRTFWYVFANKYLYFASYESKPKGGDTLTIAYALYKIAPGGNIEVVQSNSVIFINDGNHYTSYPLYFADLNDGYKIWYRYESRWYGPYFPPVISACVDKDDNLHLITKLGYSHNYQYSVYTPSNLPINAEGVTPIYSYTISYDSTINWQFKSELIAEYFVPLFDLSAFNLNKAVVAFNGWSEHIFQDPKRFSGVPGIVLIHQEFGNYRYELLAGANNDQIERERFGLGTNWYIDQMGQVYLWNSWETIVFDSVRTAYIFHYKLRSTGSDYIMNYSLTRDINKVTISPVPVGEKSGFAFRSFHYTLDKDRKMYFLVFAVDSIRPATYHLGRIFLLKETSPGQWDTMLVTTDTTNEGLFNWYTNFAVDENGVVHVVYSVYKDNKPRVFYTNNEGGSFKAPIVVDTTRVLRDLWIGVSRNGLVYILGYTGDYYHVYYYGDYVSGFRLSSRELRDFDKAGVDADGNLYIVSDPWFSGSGYQVYLYKFYRDSALTRRVLFTFQPRSPVTYPSFSFVRDENLQIHLLGTWAGKFYHWKASDNFTGRIEYDYSGLLRHDDLLYSVTSISAIANASDRRIYFFITRGAYGPLIVGWIPYVVTQVQDNNNVLPGEFKLSQNYPNPFNPVTTISFDLPVKSSVEISIYDVLGRKLKTIVNEVRDAGGYKVFVDMSGYASGVYFYRMVAKPVMGGSEFISVRKMLLIK